MKQEVVALQDIDTHCATVGVTLYQSYYTVTFPLSLCRLSEDRPMQHRCYDARMGLRELCIETSWWQGKVHHCCRVLTASAMLIPSESPIAHVQVQLSNLGFSHYR